MVVAIDLLASVLDLDGHCGAHCFMQIQISASHRFAIAEINLFHAVTATSAAILGT
jgi:hypothetical protein